MSRSLPTSSGNMSSFLAPFPGCKEMDPLARKGEQECTPWRVTLELEEGDLRVPSQEGMVRGHQLPGVWERPTEQEAGGQ